MRTTCCWIELNWFIFLSMVKTIITMRWHVTKRRSSFETMVCSNVVTNNMKMNTIHWNRQIKSKTKMYQMPSQKPDISKNILQNVLRKHIHVTSLTDNIQTNIKVMINTKWEQLAVELNWLIYFPFGTGNVGKNNF